MRKRFADLVFQLAGPALICLPGAAGAATTRTSFGVSAVVVNNCTVSSTPRAGGLNVTSRCTYPQEIAQNSAPPSPGAVRYGQEQSQGVSQGIRYFAVEY